MEFHKQSILFYLLVFFSVLLLGYTGYRSYVLCMTHDESATWNYFHEMGFWECLRTESCWHSANNHLLNTALFQYSVALFGQSDWAIRLPNVFAHLIYLGASIYIILQLTHKSIAGIAGWVLINLNPYLLDFFSLARGYGLAMGFTLLSLAFFVAFIKKPRIVWSFGIFIAIALSILSNFTQLVFLAALGLAYLLFCLQHVQWNIKKVLYWLLPPILISLILGLLLYQPILWLKNGGEFEWGTDTLYQTFWTLAEDTVYGYKHFDKTTIPIFFYSASSLTLLAFFFGFKTFFQKEKQIATTLLGLISIVFLSIVMITVLQKGILGTKYFINRKSLIFIPLWGMLVFSLLVHFSPKKVIIQQILAVFFLVMGSYHFYRCLNFEQSREWWYDRNTLIVMEYLDDKVGPNETVNLGVHWMFHPTMMYYKNTKGFTFFENIHYDKNILPDAGYDYYYVFKSNYDRFLTEGYEVEKTFTGFGYLLRKKE